MISKCQNIVINRTKFSEFDDYDVNRLPTTGLKVVGYISEYDQCSQQYVNRNVAIDYSAISEVNIITPDNYFIPDLQNHSSDTRYVEKQAIDFNGEKIYAYRVKSNFEGDFIQINIKEPYTNIFNTEKNSVRTLYFSFDKDIPLGREIKIIIKNFLVTVEDGVKNAIAVVDYKDLSSVAVNYQGGNIIESDEEFSKDNPLRNILITFKQTVINGANSDGAGNALADNRVMIATNVELVD